MRFKFEFLYLSLIIVVVSVNHTYAARSLFGEECNRTQKCDRKSWLSCQEGTCNCSKSDEMLYDEERKSCVVKSGERCKYGLDESGESSLVEILSCVTNANCNSFGLCECDSKHHEIFNGTCGLSLSFMKDCSAEEQCSKYEHLECGEGKCKCKEGEAQHSEKEGQCVGLDKNVCIHGKCIEGAGCKNDECICDSNHYDAPDKTCQLKKPIFDNCTRDVECMQKEKLSLECTSGICNCPPGFKFSKVKKYKYDVEDYSYKYNGRNSPPLIGFQGPTLEICAPIINSPCPNGYCMENAKCELSSYPPRSNIYSDAVCKCLGDRSPNRDSTVCAGTYDGTCNSDSECIDDLVCSNNKCNCVFPRHQDFYTSKKICITKVGGHCSKTSTCTDSSYCSLSSVNSTTGHCRCNEGFVMNAARSCERNYGTDCSQSPPCDSVAGLVCLNQKCSCADGMYTYSSHFRKCLGLVGANCDPSEESNICVKNPEKCDMSSSPNIACVLNAQCCKEHPMLPAECKCMDGYEETENHICEISAPDEKEEEVAIVIESF